MAKGTKKDCDRLWSRLIKERDGGCVICGKPGQAHHLIRRTAVHYRHCLTNGVCLCPAHHQLSNQISAHGNPRAFDEWMKKNMPERYKWWTRHAHNVMVGVKPDYERRKESLEKLLKGTDDGYLDMP